MAEGSSELPSLANLPWWELLHDEQLQQLIRVALAENHDLQRAVATVEEGSAISRGGQRLLDRIARSRRPFVAAIHGPALGGGLEVALACHYLLAADDPKTVLGLPEVHLGLLPGGAGTQRLPRRIGLSAALPLLLTGKRLRARQAYRLGLVDALSSPGGLAETAARAAAMLADRTLAELRRDESPVAIDAATRPLARPTELAGKVALLYSGNFGVAHDDATLLDGYERHHRKGSGRVILWLNATGAKAGRVESEPGRRGLPFHRSRPVPLAELASLLVAPDAHLITLRDEFVGYVLPSKVYGCIASGKPVRFIGSAASDVHLLCAERMAPGSYRRVDVGDAAGVAAALEEIAGG